MAKAKNRQFDAILDRHEQEARDNLAKRGDTNLDAFIDKCKKLVRGLDKSGTTLTAAETETLVDEMTELFNYSDGKTTPDVHLDVRDDARLKQIETILKAVLKQEFPDEEFQSHLTNFWQKVQNVILNKNVVGNHINHGTQFGMNPNRAKVQHLLDKVSDARLLGRRRALQGGVASIVGLYTAGKVFDVFYGEDEKKEEEQLEITEPTMKAEVKNGRTISVNIGLPKDTDLTLNQKVTFHIDIPGAKEMRQYDVKLGKNTIKLDDHILPKGGELVCALVVEDEPPIFEYIKVDAKK